MRVTKQKILSVCACISLIVLIIPTFKIESNAATSGIWAYTVNVDGTTATITACSQTTGELVIPSNLEGYIITSITSSANNISMFGTASNNTITSVLFPSTLINIGDYAFYGCSGITSVTIPNDIISIGNLAFYRCTGLTSITIPEGVSTIGNAVFYGCQNLMNITIPNSVNIIGDSAFYGCINLTDISIPNGVNIIEDLTFYGCTGLTSITIPSSVSYVGDSAFMNCSKISSITLPSGITYIGFSAFDGCSSLTFITLPSSLTAIYGSTFRSCIGLTSIIIPDSVTLISTSAGRASVSPFYNCTNLKSITLGTGVSSLLFGTFSGCTQLTSIYFRGDAPIIANAVFNRDMTPSNITLYYVSGALGWTENTYISNGASYNTATWEETELDANNVPVSIDMQATTFSVTVPTSLPITVDSNGNITTATDAKIINNSFGPVIMSNISITGLNDWVTVDYGLLIPSLEKVGSKKIAFIVNNQKTTGADTFDSFNQSNFQSIQGSGEQQIVYNAKVTPQATTLTDATVASVIFTIRWDKI